jgi:aryl-alcohol dehydrogenase-like predicted oxidoreductase
MRYIIIPGTDIKSSLICFGTVSIGSKLDQDRSFKILDAYLEQGGNFIDTAQVYSDWLPGERSSSEKTIGRWLQQRKNRDKIILATKGAHPGLATMHIGRMSRPEIEHDVNQSLQNLRTDRIDLYWLHRDAPAHPVEDIIETLNDQVKAGKIRYFGCSNWHTPRIKAAQEYAASRGLQGFTANQMQWSLALADPDKIKDKTIAVMDDAMKQYHLETGLAATPYSSQAQGFFHKLANGTIDQMAPNTREVYHAPENKHRFERLKALAAASGLSITQLILGYLHAQPFVTIPIVGCHTLEQLHDSMQAGDISLTPDQVRYLEQGE